MDARERLRRLGQAWWLGYVAALGAVALVTGMVRAVLERVHLANISMLYLIAVLATAVAFGRWPAVVASVAAFLAFDWFFVSPVHSFTAAGPAEWVALALLLLTAATTGELAAGQHRRAREAEAREREASVLYDVARLSGEPDLGDALRLVAERLRQELGIPALIVQVGVEGLGSVRADVGDAESLTLARNAANRSGLVLGAGPGPTAGRRGAPGRWIRVVSPELRTGETGPGRLARGRLHSVPIKAGNRQVGSILVVRPATLAAFRVGDDRLLSAVAAQLGAAVERQRLQREATEAEILRRSDELKTALLNAASHDLRTPLASIIAGAESLLQEDVSWTEEDRREFAEAIRHEAQRLNRIVGNLLDLSRIEAGSLRPQKGWYDLRALVDDVLGRLRPITAGHPVAVDVPDDLPPVQLDYVEIDQVLTNLIENAARHTPAGTPIEVRACLDERAIRVEVADRGPGVPKVALPHLFDPFYRIRTPGQRPRGTGLGLAVARGLVEAHGGSIQAENRLEGGARFVFTLPIGDPARAEAGAYTSEKST